MPFAASEGAAVTMLVGKEESADRGSTADLAAISNDHLKMYYAIGRFLPRQSICANWHWLRRRNSADF